VFLAAIVNFLAALFLAWRLLSCLAATPEARSSATVIASAGR
jgi:hypothetical protein